MQTFQVAHINEQGQNIIIIIVNSSFGHMPNAQQNSIKNTLQYCASSAGLAGTVVPVWDAGMGRMGFLAPTAWQNYFMNLNLQQIYMSVNRQLTCNI